MSLRRLPRLTRRNRDWDAPLAPGAECREGSTGLVEAEADRKAEEIYSFEDTERFIDFTCAVVVESEEMVDAAIEGGT